MGRARAGEPTNLRLPSALRRRSDWVGAGRPRDAERPSTAAVRTGYGGQSCLRKALHRAAAAGDGERSSPPARPSARHAPRNANATLTCTTTAVPAPKPAAAARRPATTSLPPWADTTSPAAGARTDECAEAKALSNVTHVAWKGLSSLSFMPVKARWLAARFTCTVAIKARFVRPDVRSYLRPGRWGAAWTSR